MKIISGRKMCKILSAKGWEIARITGSHHIFVRQGSDFRITVPVHGNKDLRHGLQRAIMNMADIKNTDL